MVNMGTSVVQVTNVAATANHEQMQTLFSFLGEITDLQLYPKTNLPGNQSTKICFIKFQEESCVGVARHLTNTVFIDRPLVCTPYSEGVIPNEELAMTLMPPADSLSSLAGMQGIKVDPAKLDQMQRTIYVGNLDTKTATAEEIEEYFSSCGKIKTVKLGGDVTEPVRYCFVEFESEDSIKLAMKKNGEKFQGRIIKINQSNNSVLSGGGGDNNSREIDEAMRRVRMAQSLISKALDPDKSRKKRSRSRSHSRSRRRHHRSRSRDRSRRRRSRSRSKGRRRSRSSDRRRSRRSRSRERRRKRSRSHKRSRSPSKKSSKSRHKDRKRDSDRKRSKHEKGEEKSEDKKKPEVKSPQKTEKETNGKTVEMEKE